MTEFPQFHINILMICLSMTAVSCGTKPEDKVATEEIAAKYQLDDFGSLDRQKQIDGLIDKVAGNEMDPSLKKIASEFAVDTFKIGHFQRIFPTDQVDLQTSLEVQKSVCVMNDSLISKYFSKLKSLLKNKDYQDLVESQVIWEQYKLKELSVFQRLVKENAGFEFNFYLTYNQILKSRLETLYFYYYQFVDSRYGMNAFGK